MSPVDPPPPLIRTTSRNNRSLISGSAEQCIHQEDRVLDVYILYALHWPGLSVVVNYNTYNSLGSSNFD